MNYLEEEFFKRQLPHVKVAGVENKQELVRAWNNYLVGLELSELGAARECREISNLLQGLGQGKLADMYKTFEYEEIDHAKLVSAMTPVRGTTTSRADLIFSGEALSKGNQVLTKKLIVVHSVFESSGLAILGYLNQNSHQIFEPKRADIIKACTSSILKDEVGHVWEGAEVIKTLTDTKIIEKPNLETIKVIRVHLHFIKLGFKSFFKSCPNYSNHVDQILLKFDYYLKNSMRVYGLKI